MFIASSVSSSCRSAFIVMFIKSALPSIQVVQYQYNRSLIRYLYEGLSEVTSVEISVLESYLLTSC